MMVLPIYESDVEFNPLLEDLCTLSCIQEMLTYYGIKKPLKYIDSSLNIKLVKDSGESIGYKQVLTNSKLHEEYEKNIIRFYDENSDALQVYEENRKMIESNVPVIVDLDLYEMEYQKTYQLYHGKHSVILCGFEENDPIIMDRYSWTYNGKVPLEQFLKARSSLNPLGLGPFGGKPIANAWLYVKEDGWNGKYEELLSLMLNKSIDLYYEKLEPESDGEIKGMNVHKETYKAMVEWKEISPKERTRNIKIIRKFALYMKAKLTLFQAYIKDANEELKIKELESLINSLTPDIEEWTDFCVVILKTMYNTKLDYYDKILARMAALIEREEARYSILKDAIKIL